MPPRRIRHSWQDPVDIVLRFRADQAPYVRERVWHPTQRMIEFPDGGVQSLSVPVGHLKFAGGFWDGTMPVEVILPGGLRQNIDQILSDAVTLYIPAT